ncbi:DUF6509 family protein [Neobacillus mesonae]|uniref:DUF6509 family protein n=1 Tax=Neobacillus mesonae TaxID=1193713 RepID=UPI0025739344|nr:DUF6509 family protein [Neobacillus mesonae]MED4204053.1 DUF6509 family protein [Neobacillus mesonae]
MIDLNITSYTVEKLEDPFGLLSGDRYEFFLDLDIDDEDELFSEKGVGLRVLFVAEGEQTKIVSYHFFEQGSEKVFDFALEDDEEEEILQFCKEHLAE